MGKFACFDDDPEDLAVAVAFDPGGTTGYCVMGVRPAVLLKGTGLSDALGYIDYGQIDCGTRHGQTGVGMQRGHDGLNIAGEYAGIVQMMNIIEAFDNIAVVVEDFVLDVRKANMGRDLLTPVRIIAGLSTLMQYSFGKEALDWVFVQNRSLAKTTCTDDRLKNWGLYDRDSGPHARDATRHVFYFLRTCCGSSSDAALRRYLAWPHLFDDPAITPTVKRPANAKPQVGQRVWGLG